MASAIEEHVQACNSGKISPRQANAQITILDSGAKIDEAGRNQSTQTQAGTAALTNLSNTPFTATWPSPTWSGSSSRFLLPAILPFCIRPALTERRYPQPP